MGFFILFCDYFGPGLCHGNAQAIAGAEKYRRLFSLDYATEK